MSAVNLFNRLFARQRSKRDRAVTFPRGGDFARDISVRENGSPERPPEAPVSDEEFAWALANVGAWVSFERDPYGDGPFVRVADVRVHDDAEAARAHAKRSPHGGFGRISGDGSIVEH